MAAPRCLCYRPTVAETVRQRVAAAVALAFLVLGVGAWVAAGQGAGPSTGASASGGRADDIVLLVWFAAAILAVGAWWLNRPDRPAIAARLGWPLVAASVAPLSLAVVATFDPS